MSKGQVHCGDNVLALTFPLTLADVYMQLTHTKVDWNYIESFHLFDLNAIRFCKVSERINFRVSQSPTNQREPLQPLVQWSTELPKLRRVYAALEPIGSPGFPPFFPWAGTASNARPGRRVSRQFNLISTMAATVLRSVLKTKVRKYFIMWRFVNVTMQWNPTSYSVYSVLCYVLQVCAALACFSSSHLNCNSLNYLISHSS